MDTTWIETLGGPVTRAVLPPALMLLAGGLGMALLAAADRLFECWEETAH